MKFEWNVGRTLLPFIVKMNRDTYSWMDQNEKTGLLLADGGSKLLGNTNSQFESVILGTIHEFPAKLIIELQPPRQLGFNYFWPATP